MSIPERFGKQYVANLREYRRQTPWRFLRLLIAFVVAILVGGLLHFAQNWPAPLFYALVAFLLFIAAILLVIKIIRLFARTYDETRYIVYGKDSDGSRSTQSSLDTVPVEIVEPDGSTPLPPIPPPYPHPHPHPHPKFAQKVPSPLPPPAPRSSAVPWIVGIGLFGALLCSGCLGLPLLFLWGAHSVRRQPVPPPVPFQEPFQQSDEIRRQHEEAVRQMERRIQEQWGRTEK